VPLSRSEKEALVQEVNAVASDALSLVGAEYRGITAEDLRELRKQAHESGVYLRVIKNTLARRAFADTEFECVSEALTGPMLLAFSQGDPGSAARVVKEFAKKNKKLDVKLVSVGGLLLPAADIERLASLPTRVQALGMLAGVIQAPISKFVRTLAEPPAKLARVIAAVRDQKEAA
jgi:large subunit ribosomal protein L10